MGRPGLFPHNLVDLRLRQGIFIYAEILEIPLVKRVVIIGFPYVRLEACAKVADLHRQVFLFPHPFPVNVTGHGARLQDNGIVGPHAVVILCADAVAQPPFRVHRPRLIGGSGHNRLQGIMLLLTRHKIIVICGEPAAVFLRAKEKRAQPVLPRVIVPKPHRDCQGILPVKHPFR